MTFNPSHSPYGMRFNTNSNQPNLISNPSLYYQSHTSNAQQQKNPENNSSYFVHSSSPNPNLLHVGSKFPQEKFIPQQFDRKVDSWKYSETNTAKSMVFMQPQRETPSVITPKKTFAGFTKLSEMARPINNHFDDADDYQTNKKSDLPNKSNFIPENKDSNFKKFGNNLAPQTSNFKTAYQKEGNVASSMLFCQSDERNNVYKSFIHYGSNNNGAQSKKTGGLEFLMKFKKEQQEKKQKQDANFVNVNLKFKTEKIISENGNRNFLSPTQNENHKISHEYSAPDLGHFQKNYHHEPIPIHITQKNPDKKVKNQLQSHVHAQSTQNSPYFTNEQKKSSPLQQPHTQNFLKKFNSDKVDRYAPQKSFHSQSEIPSSKKEGTSPIIKKFSFTKKDSNEMTGSFGATSETTPMKDKFVSPAFFKNRKMFSDAKTIETTPSPSSVKNKFSYQEYSPTYISSTLSEDGSMDESIECIDTNFSSQELKQWSLDDFQLGDKLGKGAFGDVFIARQKHLGFFCVLKRMSKKRIKDLKREEHVIRQLKIQLYLNHKHLTSMYGYFHDKQNIYLVLQYLPDGNLSQIKKRKRTSQTQTASIIYQVCQGLTFMHKRRIIHRDIKPQNIFVNEGYMKLGDFGCSVETDGMRKTVVSCLQYSSPQQLSGQCYNEKIDVWGVGILAYELLVGKSPFENEIMNMNSQQIKFNDIKFPQQLKISAIAQDFIRCLLNTDPIQRIDIEEAIEHKFITSNYHPQEAMQLV